MAGELDQLNKERKATVETIAGEAEKQARVAAAKHQKAFVIAGDNWHQGVIGIVASRIVETFYRPTIILSIDPETGLAKGSARSIDGFNLYRALSDCSGCLKQFGGHEMAAGMTLPKDNIASFRLQLNQVAEAVLDEQTLTPVQWIDSRFEADEATVDLINQFEQFAPFGTANPKPVFQLAAAPFASAKTVGQSGNHLKMVFKGHEAALDGIGFGLGARAAELAAGDHVSAVGELGVNEWNGFRKPQLFIHDLKVDDWQLFDWRHEQKMRAKIRQLPGDETTLLVFHRETEKEIGFQDIEDELTVYEADCPIIRANLVLLDLPDHLSQLEKLVAMNPGIGRIYAVFHHSREHFFSAFPTREHFKWYYAVIRREQSFRLSPMLKQIARYKGWQMETIQFMTKVFFELDFVKIEGDVLISNTAPQKTPLTASETYRKQLNQMQLEDRLCYSSLSSLKAWFNEIRQGECTPSAEEKSVHGL
ncbi:single-stranded-DNA-specific exonuclease C-terminal domain-containing protein [Terrilactibacillus sp. S3-3]|nr:single-stranded-DNA-specific exonuclease C-terminal domain-containing protein [Terrilactibacillus sp. S3-3]